MGSKRAVAKKGRLFKQGRVRNSERLVWRILFGWLFFSLEAKNHVARLFSNLLCS